MNLENLIAIIRGWIKYHDPEVIPDDMIISWIRMGEERINNQLRVGEQLQIDTANIVNSRVMVPRDWKQSDFTRIVDGPPIDFMSRSEFYRHDMPKGRYTSSGRFLIFGGPPDAVEGMDVELHYFANIPSLGDDPNWISEKHPSVLIAASLIPAYMFIESPERSVTWEAGLNGNIATLNDNYRESIGSGSSILKTKTKGFG